MLVNEGLPDYLVRRMEQEHDLPSMTVGILGMAFKAESDDRRSSLSYRLKRVLAFRAGRVLTTDPYVADDPDLVPLEQLLAEADLLVVGAPHAVYRDLDVDLPVVDVWNLLGRGRWCERPCRVGDRPRLPRGRGHRPGARPARSTGSRSSSRSWSSSTTPTTRRSPPSASTSGDDPRMRPW